MDWVQDSRSGTRTRTRRGSSLAGARGTSRAAPGTCREGTGWLWVVRGFKRGGGGGGGGEGGGGGGREEWSRTTGRHLDIATCTACIVSMHMCYMSICVGYVVSLRLRGLAGLGALATGILWSWDNLIAVYLAVLHSSAHVDRIAILRLNEKKSRGRVWRHDGCTFSVRFPASCTGSTRSKLAEG